MLTLIKVQNSGVGVGMRNHVTSLRCEWKGVKHWSNSISPSQEAILQRSGQREKRYGEEELLQKAKTCFLHKFFPGPVWLGRLRTRGTRVLGGNLPLPTCFQTDRLHCSPVSGLSPETGAASTHRAPLLH